MVIAYIMRYWPYYGGGETITATLANEFVRRGHSVHILYSYRNDIEPKPYVLDKNVKEVQMDTLHLTNENVSAMRGYLDANRVDVMINQWALVDLCDAARKGLKTKLITCWHLDVIQEQKPEGLRQRLIYKILGSKNYQNWRTYKQLKNHSNNYAKSDKYIFLSKSFEDHYRELSKCMDRLNKLDSISNPLTYNFKYDIANYNSKMKEVLFVGRIFEYHKRLSYILKIWKSIEEKPELNDWSLRIVGDGPDMASTKQLSNKLGLHRISFEGFKNPRPFYETASIFMMTSAFEGFGMTLVEAQQYGVVPIVMDTYSSLHDILVNKENGIIIQDNDLKEFANELTNLMVYADFRKRLALNGLQSCQKFSVESIVNQWEQLFVSLCDCE